MDIRAEFEAYMRKIFAAAPEQAEIYLERQPAGHYTNTWTQGAWAGYQAGRLAGQKDMRDRAALESLAFGGNPSVVRAIRALPVEGE